MISRRRFITTALATLGSSSALANAPSYTPRPRMRGLNPLSPGRDGLEAILKNAGLSGEVVCAVADARNGQVLESADGDRGLPPASVAKVVTALYALDTLGAGHRFRTRLIATGPVQNGVLQGDLVLVGGGDPTLSTDGLADLAAGMKAAGLRQVSGRFLVWDGMLPFVKSIDPGQPDHVGYSPAVSGIALNFNRVHFEWKRAGGSWAVSMDARTQKYRPEVFTSKMAVVRRDLPVYTYQDKSGVDHWTVASGALGNGGARWLPVRNPALYAGDVFQTLARAHGIALPNPRQVARMPSGSLIAQHQSDPLPVLLKGMLKYSNNLMAEMIGMSASLQRDGRPGSLAASGRSMSSWATANLGMQSCRLVDHSGLGDQSRLSANDMLRALVLAHRDGALKPLLKRIYLQDAKGRPMKTHPVQIAAKTGTLNFVSGLGGFVTAEDGRELAFAIFSADLSARSRISRAERERPAGGRSWNRRAKRLQQALLARWGQVYGS
ncbi:D-alanyl-D-alanine carboxypeptidase/D-alanyl-D-alanine endopeptidase [Epibacterium sp. Ofav1-8]|uniref:D-alanyl-D-alanine carboxypeptidase/D-alanyl-D-alanine endopeptidase n=1 Tax=Epibacterium sp. Ofav1-8 TaxID=2917735 RepID=UPI001EF50725|nr:D-alanyl-D-alanine carboxypeptidase/D-alanyl-D-alanine-endopeptidase [Epibacterium sp. Ofav1-8]MCG7624339.1 D-alanyl-D-alanine carboxypeptidase/D-alanyl-D-alanine-endopeptidase [Epibacterium sp. Ofav1-8]